MRSRTIEYSEEPPFSDAFKQNLERLSRLFAEVEIASPKARETSRKAAQNSRKPKAGNDLEE